MSSNTWSGRLGAATKREWAKCGGVSRAALPAAAFAAISLGVVGRAAAESPPGCTDATVSVSVTPTSIALVHHGDTVCYAVCYGATGTPNPCDIAGLNATLVLPNLVTRPVLNSASIAAGTFFCCPSADPRCNPALTADDYCYVVNHADEIFGFTECPPIGPARIPGIGKVVAYTEGSGISQTPIGDEIAPCVTANNSIRHACCHPCTGVCNNTTEASCTAPRIFTPDKHCNQVTCTPLVCLPLVPPCEAGQTCSATTDLCVDLPDPPLGTFCELDNDPCTSEHCNGLGVCTNNGFAAFGTACGNSADTECTNPDTCNGAGTCLANHEPATTNCGDAGTQCTNQDSCNGVGACADNGFMATGTACGSNADTECTNPDTCNGAGTCLPNHEPNTTNCGDFGTECMNEDKCDGVGGCTDNGFKPFGAVCRPAAGACNPAEVCNGVNGICPSDAVITSCINSDGCCPPGCNNINDNDCLFLACGPGRGDCCVAHANPGCQDIACCHTVCAVDLVCCDDEWDQICVNEALQICRPSGCLPSICGDGIIEVGEDCDPPDGVCCRNVCLFQPNSVECRPTAGACDVAETCTGVSAICPADAKSTAECRPAAGVCDLAESCDGVSNTCPTEAMSTGVCRPSTGACDLPESCNGVSNTCPADFVITRCTNSDGCCPAGCNNTNDNDCLVTTVLKWESVLTHSPNQPVPIALDIPDTGLFSEPRSGVKKIVVTFDGPINPATAIPANVTVCGNDVNNVPVDLSLVLVSTATTTGDTKMEINFAPALPNYARYRIALKTSILAANGAPIQADSRILTALQGDASGDRRVGATDLGGARGLVGVNPINPATLNEVRSDANDDGRINSTDVGGIRGRVGNDARDILDPVCP